MERDGEFHRYRRHAKSSSASTIGLPMNSNSNVNPNTKTGDADANPNTNTSSVAGAPPCMVREQDHYMPIANVIRIMRRILPSHAKISDDAKETIQECVSEFISFVTGEANERCQREQRKTVTAEDVLWAMGKLGFDNYIEPLTVFLNRNRESENERGIILRGDHQIQLPYLKRGMDVHGPVGMVQPYGPGFPMGHHLGVFDPSAVGGYYREVPGSGAGSSSTTQYALASFDPFAHQSK